MAKFWEAIIESCVMKSNFPLQEKSLKYRTRTIITRGLYIFYSTFHCGLYCRAERLDSVTDNLCTKQENSSIFGSKIRGFKSRAGYNGTRTVIILE